MSQGFAFAFLSARAAASPLGLAPLIEPAVHPHWLHHRSYPNCGLMARRPPRPGRNLRQCTPVATGLAQVGTPTLVACVGPGSWQPHCWRPAAMIGRPRIPGVGNSSNSQAGLPGDGGRENPDAGSPSNAGTTGAAAAAGTAGQPPRGGTAGSTGAGGSTAGAGAPPPLAVRYAVSAHDGHWSSDVLLDRAHFAERRRHEATGDTWTLGMDPKQGWGHCGTCAWRPTCAMADSLLRQVAAIRRCAPTFPWAIRAPAASDHSASFH
jgi:hypothetical protein